MIFQETSGLPSCHPKHIPMRDEEKWEADLNQSANDFWSRTIMVVAAITVCLLVTAVSAQSGTQPPHIYYSGTGGKGMTLAVLEPVGKGLSEDDRWMLSLIQGCLTANFNKYSAITIIDRQNVEMIMEDIAQAMESGYYSDETMVKVGYMTNARYVLTGVVTKTATAVMIEFAVTDAQKGERKASYAPKPVSLLALEDLTAVNEATIELLKQLKVNLTSTGLAELKKAPDMNKIWAENALARGVVAQRKGTNVKAMSYYFQAADFDPSLVEAVSRSSILSANIRSGNIGEDTRNDIAWRKSWIDRLTETETYFDSLFKTVSIPYTLFYSKEIIPGKVDYKTETQTLSINTILHRNSARFVHIEKTLLTVLEGLEATKRMNAWELQRWPWGEKVTDLNPFAEWKKEFTVTFELVNGKNKVIGKTEFKTGGKWEVSAAKSDDVKKVVIFNGVNANDITDKLTIRVMGVNGVSAQDAARTGVLQIRALPQKEWERNDMFTAKNGTLLSYAHSFWDNKLGKMVSRDSNLVIPDTIWGEAVTAIGDHAFYDKDLNSVVIPKTVRYIGKGAFANSSLRGGVTIPGSVVTIGPSAFHGSRFAKLTISSGTVTIENGAFRSNVLLGDLTISNTVTSIGDYAFYENDLMQVTIPKSVTTIGVSAFSKNFSLDSITIGANVKIADLPEDAKKAWGYKEGAYDRFVRFYTDNGSRAGRYINARDDMTDTRSWTHNPLPKK